MKDISELNPRGFPTNDNIDKNLAVLFNRVMDLQAAAKMNFTITSGLRSEAFQLELIAAGKTNAKHSYHCAGAAADIFDPRKKLRRYILDNEAILKACGLYCEDFTYTKNWVHVQILAPKSGKRIFIP